MDIPTFLLITAYALLAIVVAAAAICLLALIGKVRVNKSYEKALFSSIIIASASMIIASVRTVLVPIHRTVLSEELLLSPQPSWDSSYPENSWRTKGIFERTKDGIVFSGVTYAFVDRQKIPVIRWSASQAINLPTSGDRISLAVSKKWTDEAATIYPEIKYEVGKDVPGIMTLSVDVGLRGLWLPKEGTRGAWGLVFSRAEP